MRVFFFLVLLFSTCSVAQSADISSVGTYSEGYRMGMLSKFSPDKGFISSGEGELLMGSESSILRDEKKGIINPWAFSSIDKGIINTLSSNVGKYVVLRYNEARVKSPKVSTPYEIVEVLMVGKPLDKICNAKGYSKGMKSKNATRTGRIIKASYKGTAFKSWELTVQQGDSGNQFHNMSITEDSELYDCAVAYLKAGQRVQIEYDESYTGFGNIADTKVDIISISPLSVSQGLN